MSCVRVRTKRFYIFNRITSKYINIHKELGGYPIDALHIGAATPFKTEGVALAAMRRAERFGAGLDYERLMMVVAVPIPREEHSLDIL